MYPSASDILVQPSAHCAFLESFRRNHEAFRREQFGTGQSNAGNSTLFWARLLAQAPLLGGNHSRAGAEPIGMAA